MSEEDWRERALKAEAERDSLIREASVPVEALRVIEQEMRHDWLVDWPAAVQAWADRLAVLIARIEGDNR